jgi:YbgC/YbaW family acyl-CoA thioester hydrolase
MTSALQEIRFRGKSAKYFVLEDLRPRFNEIDSYQVMWNGHYVNYFEMARLAMCRQFEFDMETLSKLGYFLPVYSYGVDIMESVFPQDVFKIAVRPLDLKPGIFSFLHLMLKGQKIVAVCKLKHVMICKQSLKVVSSEKPEIREVFNQFEKTFGV